MRYLLFRRNHVAKIIGDTDMKHRGYDIIIPASGGKAGKGRNVTGSVQVRKHDMILKQFRFKIASDESRERAQWKARVFIENRISEQETARLAERDNLNDIAMLLMGGTI